MQRGFVLEQFYNIPPVQSVLYVENSTSTPAQVAATSFPQLSRFLVDNTSPNNYYNTNIIYNRQDARNV